MPPSTDTSQVANTGIELTRLGLGVATQGRLFRDLSDDEATAVFESAWKAGIRYFDTAPWYGLGLAEQRIGKFLRSKEGYVLSSKVGWLLREGISTQLAEKPYSTVYDFSYDGFMRSFEESLERLGVDTLDIMTLTRWELPLKEGSVNRVPLKNVPPT